MNIKSIFVFTTMFFGIYFLMSLVFSKVAEMSLEKIMMNHTWFFSFTLFFFWVPLLFAKDYEDKIQ